VVVESAVAAGAGLSVRLGNHITGGVVRTNVDWVVVAAPGRADDHLWRSLRDGPFELHRIGDCLAPRRASVAILDGDRVGALL
jgi:hypothetical protein